MQKYRKKPVVVDAWQLPLTKEDRASIIFKMQGHERDIIILESDEQNRDTKLSIKTLEGTMTAENDDWLIRGVEGEFYPCKNSVFEATYEKVE